jgi:protein gp37
MENSKIEWTDHTFSPWWGCMKVSRACKNCYAEVMDKRMQGGQHWGPNSTRKMQSERYWAQPIKWNAEAGRLGIKKKVFCASMADVFEDHPDVHQARMRLFKLVEDTPNLIWLFLTKRTNLILNTVPDHWLGNHPKNVWYGTTTEDQVCYDERIEHLLAVKKMAPP